MFRQLPRWQPGPAQHLSRGVQEAGPNSIVVISENRINSGLLPVQDPTLPTLISYAACPFRPGEFRVSGAVLLDRCYRRRAAVWGEGGMSEQQLCGADAVERSRGCWGREEDFAVKSSMLVAILWIRARLLDDSLPWEHGPGLKSLSSVVCTTLLQKWTPTGRVLGKWPHILCTYICHYLLKLEEISWEATIPPRKLRQQIAQGLAKQ
jgi:hypothetical protein